MTTFFEETVLARVPDGVVSTRELARALPDAKRQSINYALAMLTAERLVRRVYWGMYEITAEGKKQREKLLQLRQGMEQGQMLREKRKLDKAVGA